MTDKTPPEKPKLKPASENPWYVLMTVAGEQPEREHSWQYDEDLHARNRRYFNGWMAQHLSDEQKKDLREKKRASAKDLADLTEEEQAKIARQIAERCPDGAALTNEDARVNLAGSEVAGRLICIGFVFSGDAYFSAATFSGPADFSAATFSGPAFFRAATFSGPADFSAATFSEYADFENATFSGSAFFRAATFSGDAYFSDATFSGSAFFRAATFSGPAFFRAATFSGPADFSAATFSGPAFFRAATFSGPADFSAATFSGPAFFQNAGFKATTTFKGLVFKGPRASPPQFYDATLHEDTSWEGIKSWPKPKDGQEPEDFIRAYEKLKLLMDDKNKLYSEHMFHKLELQCREIAEPKTLASRTSRLFGLISDYGWSIKRPAVGLVGVVALGWILIYANQLSESKMGEADYLGFWTYGSLSVSNVFGFLGLSRTFLSEEIKTLTAFSEVVSAFQTVFGLILFFLLGLALRNRFRIK